MLRGVLGQPKSESRGNLLQLAQANGTEEDAGTDETPLTQAQLRPSTHDSSAMDAEGSNANGEAPPTGAESLITQVNSRESTSRPEQDQGSPTSQPDDLDGRPTWRNKVRYVL